MNNKKEIKVLLLSRWYPHKYDPMWGLFVKRHAQAVSSFCDVSVFYIHSYSESKLTYEADFLHENNIPTLRIYYKEANQKVSFIGQIINVIRYVRSNYKGLKYLLKNVGAPDIIHVNVLTRAGLLALFLKCTKGIPYVITEHWTRYLPTTNCYRGTLRKFITRIVVKNASAVLPVTEDLKNAMLSHGLKNDNYIIVPNVVDTDNFKPTSVLSVNDKKVIIHLSCFDDKQKNISGILRVIKKLSLKRQDFIIRLVGDGPDKINLEKYAEELGVKNKFVVFDGLKIDDELVQIMQHSDCLLMFSNYENLPVVILESYACGVPVISTDVGGISEHLTDELGILVNPGDENDLLLKIESFFDNQRVYDKDKIRKYAVNNFSNKTIGECFLKIYQDILTNNKLK